MHSTVCFNVQVIFIPFVLFCTMAFGLSTLYDRAEIKCNELKLDNNVCVYAAVYMVYIMLEISHKYTRFISSECDTSYNHPEGYQL